MEKIVFEDLPSTTTPLNASNLNKIQENAENAIEDIEKQITSINEKFITGKYIRVVKLSTQAVPRASVVDVIWDISTTNTTNGILKLEDNKIVLKEGNHTVLINVQVQNIDDTTKYLYVKKSEGNDIYAIQSMSNKENTQSISLVTYMQENEGVLIQYYSESASTIKNAVEWTNLTVTLLN